MIGLTDHRLFLVCLNSLCTSGERYSTDITAQLKFLDELMMIIKVGEYSRNKIVGVDEMGLFWKMLPSQTFTSKEEEKATGLSICKDHVILVHSGNVECETMLMPLLVYDSQNQ